MAERDILANIRFSLNDYMDVQLTAYGEQHLLKYATDKVTEINHDHPRLNMTLDEMLDTLRRKKPDGVTQFLVWQFMNVFGGLCFHGNQNFIKDSKFVLHRNV